MVLGRPLQPLHQRNHRTPIRTPIRRHPIRTPIRRHPLCRTSYGFVMVGESYFIISPLPKYIQECAIATAIASYTVPQGLIQPKVSG